MRTRHRLPNSSPHPTELPADIRYEGAFAPRQLMWYRDADGSHMVLMWTEYVTAADQLHPGRWLRALKCYHVLYTSDSGGVAHKEVPPSDGRAFTPTAAITTPGQFEAYLKDRLRRMGGPAEVWRLLGMAPPPQETKPASDGAAKAADELYARAARLLQVPEDQLRKRYGHLNPGLQAMNLRNRLRAKGHNV